MDNISEYIKNSQKIAVISHIDEDMDAFGSSLAMREALENMGKDVTLFVSKPIEKRISFLSDKYEIFSKDKASGHYDLLICLDSGDMGRIGERECLFKISDKSVNIDHHYTNTMYADINRVDGEMSSASEMVFDLFCEMGIEITKPIAEYLYSGIMGDTGCLKYSSATPKTVMVISKLMEKGIDHAELSRKLFDTMEYEAVKLNGYVMNNLLKYFDSKVILAALDESILTEFGVSEKDTGDIVNIPRSVKGCEIAVYIKKTEERTKISLRSNGKYNVGEIAQKFGGGGHKMAAGISLEPCSIEEAKEKLLKVIGEIING